MKTTFETVISPFELQKKNKYLLLSLSSFVIGAAILLMPYLLSSNEYFNELVFANLSLMFFLLVLPPIISAVRGRFDSFEVINLFLLMFTLGYFIPAIMIVVNPSVSGYNTLGWWDFDNTTFQQSLFYGNLALLSLLAGYSVRTTNIRSHRPIIFTNQIDIYQENRVKIVLIILVAIFIASNFLLGQILGERTTRGIGYEYGYGIFQPFTATGLYIPLLYYTYFYSRQKLNIFFASISLIYIFYSITTSGSRGGILIMMLSFLIYRHYLVKKLTLLFSFASIAFASFVVIYVGVYRFDAFTKFDINYLFEMSRMIYLQTFSGLETLMVVISQVPSNISFYNGELIVEANLLPFTPRILFPMKKAIYGYNSFWEDFIHLITEAKTEQFVSLPGQFYLDFGILGIVVGSFIVGLFFKTIYGYFLFNRSNRGVVFLYGLFLTIIVQTTPFGFPTTYIWLQNFIIPYIIVRYIYKNSPKFRLKSRGIS